jgi:glycosyltransferase involved in cell wall biosynthesis
MSGLVSVIVPVYNGERFLAEALDSVFAQTYRPLEVIVVDDGSTDGSAALAAGYPLDRFVEQANEGPASARNRGLEAATGDLIAFVDADDVAPPTKIESQAAYLADHPEVGYVLGRHEVVLDGVEAPPWLVRDPVYGDLDGIPSASAVFRADVLRLVGGFDASYRYGEFADLFVRLRAAGVERAILDEIVLKRRLHGDNLNYRERPTAHPLLKSLREELARRRTQRESEGTRNG